ncbi:hypothetical protein BASA81_000970 [Batrachochytrium salamandrivorans]|nr:hypothetical protein BASA81_000970 [Batrachochytrium salamandrivorans]
MAVVACPSGRLSVLLEFAVVQRSEPESDPTRCGKRGKIQGGQKAQWLSIWIPWEEHMSVTVFVRNLKRELASQSFACRGDVERDLAARILEAKAQAGNGALGINASVGLLLTTSTPTTKPLSATKAKRPRLTGESEHRKRTCPNCQQDTTSKSCECALGNGGGVTTPQLGKGKKVCKNCNQVIASSRKECPVCDTSCIGNKEH